MQEEAAASTMRARREVLEEMNIMAELGELENICLYLSLCLCVSAFVRSFPFAKDMRRLPSSLECQEMSMWEFRKRISIFKSRLASM